MAQPRFGVHACNSLLVTIGALWSIAISLQMVKSSRYVGVMSMLGSAWASSRLRGHMEYVLPIFSSVRLAPGSRDYMVTEYQSSGTVACSTEARKDIR